MKALKLVREASGPDVEPGAPNLSVTEAGHLGMGPISMNIEYRIGW